MSWVILRKTGNGEKVYCYSNNEADTRELADAINKAYKKELKRQNATVSAGIKFIVKEHDNPDALPKLVGGTLFVE